MTCTLRMGTSKASARPLSSRHRARWHPLRSHHASWESQISCAVGAYITRGARDPLPDASGVVTVVAGSSQPCHEPTAPASHVRTAGGDVCGGGEGARECGD